MLEIILNTWPALCIGLVIGSFFGGLVVALAAMSSRTADCEECMANVWKRETMPPRLPRKGDY